MITQLSIELYYAPNVPPSKHAELEAVNNVNEWLKDVAADIIIEGGTVHYEIGVGSTYRIFLENISNNLAARAFEELDRHRGEPV